jgi:adenylate cyclase
MGIEIERKFLVIGDSWRQRVARREFFRQGYLANEGGCSVRVRIAGEQAWINLKGRVQGARRLEFEYEIPSAEATEILDQLACEGTVEKYRHWIDVGGHEWEVDEFLGANAGLMVAELELDDENETFERPPWLGAEVTDDVRYYNSSLAKTPWPTWPAVEQRP